MARLKEGYVQVYTGNWKRKNYSSNEMTFESCSGDDMEVKVVQFPKSWKTGELRVPKRDLIT